MVKKVYFLLGLVSLSVSASSIDTTIIENKIAFIVEQKETIKQEKAQLLIAYKQAKIAAKEVLKDEYVFVSNQIKAIVELVLESQEFDNYNQYITDFQCSLIATGGLKAQELPSLGPDRPLSTKIGELLSVHLTVELLQIKEVNAFFGSLLTLKANAAGTSCLLEKLTNKEQQLKR